MLTGNVSFQRNKMTLAIVDGERFFDLKFCPNESTVFRNKRRRRDISTRVVSRLSRNS